MRKLLILVVDDDDAVRRAVEDMLTRDGHVVAVASGGAAGIAALHEAHARAVGFDLVLTDLNMPEVDGRRVAAAVKNVSPGTRVVIMTARGGGILAGQSCIVQVDRILFKPFALGDLRNLIFECMSSLNPSLG